MSGEHLLLKWGTLKAWKIESPDTLAKLQAFAELGMSGGSAQQVMTEAHKVALCELINAIDGPITNDWTDENMTKDQAKAYVMEYSR